jgi:hypothetical protein
MRVDGHNLSITLSFHAIRVNICNLTRIVKFGVWRDYYFGVHTCLLKLTLLYN